MQIPIEGFVVVGLVWMSNFIKKRKEKDEELNPPDCDCCEYDEFYELEETDSPEDNRIPPYDYPTFVGDLIGG